MTDNPFDQFDAPQGGAPVITDDGSNWASQPAQKSQANPFDQFDAPKDTGYFAPERKVLGMMQADPLGTAGKLASTAAGGVYNAAKDAVTGNWFAPLAHQAGEETSANTASPGTAGQVASMATMATPGDMLAPGVSGRMVQAAAERPTTKELFSTANSGYGDLRNLGVHYDPDHVSSMASSAQDALGDLGLSSEVAPQTHAILNKLGNPPEGAVSVPLTGLTNARSVLGRIGQGSNPVDRLASKKAISALDDFVQNPPAEAVLAGDASAAADTLKTANGNYAAAKRSDKVEGKGDYAQFRADSANSGTNLDNQIRQQVRPLLDPRYPQRLNGFNHDETQAIQGIVQGSGPRNFLRSTGNTLGGGGGLGRLATGAIGGNAGAAAGYMGAGPIGAAVGSTLGATVPPMIGSAARSGANALAKKSVEDTAGLIRERSPLFKDRQAQAGMDTPLNVPGIAAERALGTLSPQPDTDQPAYAKGGAVKKPTHEFLVQRLMKLAEKAKKAEKKVTKPILSMNDDTVTAALAKAQAAI